jgi:hypothetical protein
VVYDGKEDREMRWDMMGWDMMGWDIMIWEGI